MNLYKYSIQRLFFYKNFQTSLKKVVSLNRSNWMRGAQIWKHYANYFPVKLIKTAELDPEAGNYLLGNHPHGLLCSGAFACFATEGADFSKIFPGLLPSLLTLEVGTVEHTSKNP